MERASMFVKKVINSAESLPECTTESSSGTEIHEKHEEILLALAIKFSANRLI